MRRRVPFARSIPLSFALLVSACAGDDGGQTATATDTSSTSDSTSSTATAGETTADSTGTGTGTTGTSTDTAGTTLCGNGALDPGETCDDGNGAADDGCGSRLQERVRLFVPRAGRALHLGLHAVQCASPGPPFGQASPIANTCQLATLSVDGSYIALSPGTMIDGRRATSTPCTPTRATRCSASPATPRTSPGAASSSR
jgi:cysteine-rich repeat protein